MTINQNDTLMYTLSQVVVQAPDKNILARSKESQKETLVKLENIVEEISLKMNEDQKQIDKKNGEAGRRKKKSMRVNIESSRDIGL